MSATLFLLAALSGDPIEPSLIDAPLRQVWKTEGVTPAARCDDATFLRRVTLDLAGRIPTLEEIRRFEKEPDRDAKIDELLASPEFSRNFSEIWTAALNGYADLFDSDREVLRRWLAASLEQETPYDRIASQLIAAQGTSAFDGPVNFLIRHPEDPVVKVGRLFLGVRLDCARCHDHPFAKWTSEDYEQMRRFFEMTERREVSEGNVQLVDRRPPSRDDAPRFLTGARPRTLRWRAELALMTIRSRPFARTFVNRLWYHFLGRGLVEPVDDFHAQNPAAAPDLLEQLADEALRTQYDVRAMCRLICRSEAYQLESAAANFDPERRRLFAVQAVKPLTIEQQLRSLTVALDLNLTERRRNALLRAAVGQDLDADFSRPWERRETMQSLMTRLTMRLEPPTRSVDELFLRTLGRKPREQERAACRDRPPGDVLFALVHGNEFCFNH